MKCEETLTRDATLLLCAVSLLKLLRSPKASQIHVGASSMIRFQCFLLANNIDFWLLSLVLST